MLSSSLSGLRSSTKSKLNTGCSRHERQGLYRPSLQQYDGRACTRSQRSADKVQLSHGPEVLTPTFVGHIHPPPPSKDRSPLSWALNPPQSAPLQHINSGTGTNCPTLDVLETQIASAASAPQTPQHSTPNRRKPSKEESQNCWFLCPVLW